MPIRMEVCVDCLGSVKAVEEYVSQGENRYEVCSNLLSGGGLTPSLGLIRLIRKRHPSARLMTMIRPRTGSFVYSEDELLTMASDILAFKEEGVMGFVFGCLTAGGEVDVAACRSGHSRTALEGAWTLNELVESTRYLSTLPDHREITITLASGINDENLSTLRKLVPNLQEIHLSASGAWMPEMSFSLAKGAQLGFGSGEEWRIERDRVRRVWEAVTRWNAQERE
ncbi:hypothetical protein JCM24511_06453 [Saitozyma sp. JCM 24511]|nr:hypothetical protein JCM24511_06453 [Saitozyma sp. JCM 24511]